MTPDQKFANHIRDIAKMELSDLDQNPNNAIRLRELEALFDSYLPGANKEEIAKVADIQNELEIHQSRLLSLLDEGILGAIEYADALNSEMTWSMRRYVSILGRDRCTQLFGVDDFSHISLVQPEIMFQSEAAKLVSRYKPDPKEQTRLLAVMHDINPQLRTSVSKNRSLSRTKHGELFEHIRSAEDNYNCGDVTGSIGRAGAVLSAVNAMTEITDTPLYLAAWAEHIQGRGYEAMSEWKRATFHYEASLTIKDCLATWLPTLTVLTTEAKLGSVELFQSPQHSLSRLLRVKKALTSRSNRIHFKNLNETLYSNLLEDSLVGLAEAHLAIGERDMAISEAKSALRLARKLNDAVGMVRIAFVLYHANESSPSKFETQVSALIRKDKALSDHPRVAMLLGTIRKESHET